MSLSDLKASADGKMNKGDYSQAVLLYTKAIKAAVASSDTTPTLMASLYGNKSVAHLMLEEYKKSLNDALKGFEIDKSNIKLLHRAACAAWSMGDVAKAIELIELYTSQEMRGESLERDYMRCLDAKKYLDEIEAHKDSPISDNAYKKLINTFPECIIYSIRAAESLFRRNHFLPATKVLGDVPVEDRSLTLQTLLARCFFFAGCDHLQDALNAVEAPAPLHASLGEDKNRSMISARRAHETLIRAIKEVDEKRRKGDRACEKKDFVKGCEAYTKAIQAANGNRRVLAEILTLRGSALIKLEKIGESINDFNKALENNPSFASAYAGRARCSLLLRNPTEAVKDFKKAVCYDSLNDAYQTELAEAEGLLGGTRKNASTHFNTSAAAGKPAPPPQHASTDQSALEATDYYSLLNVTSSSEVKEIKVRYRELSLRWHPDKCVGESEETKKTSEMMFRRINEAYSTLCDPVLRQEYDRRLARMRRRGKTGGFDDDDDDFFSGRQVFRDPNAPKTSCRAAGTDWW